jgi:hypothetical protein
MNGGRHKYEKDLCVVETMHYFHISTHLSLKRSFRFYDALLLVSRCDLTGKKDPVVLHSMVHGGRNVSRMSKNGVLAESHTPAERSMQMGISAHNP